MNRPLVQISCMDSKDFINRYKDFKPDDEYEQLKDKKNKVIKLQKFDRDLNL